MADLSWTNHGQIMDRCDTCHCRSLFLTHLNIPTAANLNNLMKRSAEVKQRAQEKYRKHPNPECVL